MSDYMFKLLGAGDAVLAVRHCSPASHVDASVLSFSLLRDHPNVVRIEVQHRGAPLLQRTRVGAKSFVTWAR